MRKFFTLSILGAACLAWTMNAAPRSAEDALRVAMSFYQEQSLLRSVSDADFRLVYTGESEGLRSAAEPYYYIYNVGEDEGFVMVSGDDRVDAVIGYGLSGSFDPNKIPANMAGWFKEYERQIDFARTLPENVYPAEASLSAENNLPNRVEPLIQTKWDQGAPYNDLCPMIGDQRALTGCGATAMAQIMNYYQWPEKATGKGYYTIPELGVDTTWVDLGQYTFDWANMTDTYDENATPAQREAVAELMAAAGAAIGMMYGLDASGAYFNLISTGFVQHMGYDKNAAYVKRSFYDSESWNTLMKKELASGRPIFYMAQAIIGGHLFICDGYIDSPDDSFFHINWGWGGYMDNYFKLDLLNEYDLSAALAGFSWGQTAVIGIQKPTEQSKPLEIVGMMGLEPEKESIAQGDTLRFAYHYQYIGTLSTKSVEHGYALLKDGKEVAIHGTMKSEALPLDYWMNIGWYIDDLRLDPGTYELRLFYRMEGDEEWKAMTPTEDAVTFDFTLTATEDRIYWNSNARMLTGKPITMERSEIGAYSWIAHTTLYNGSDTEETQATLLAHITSEALGMDTILYTGGVYLSPSEALDIWHPLTIQLEPGEYTIELLANNELESYLYAIEGTRTTFAVDNLTATEAIEANTTMVYQSGERLIVRTDEPIQVIRLYDRSGRLVRTGDEAELSTAGLPAGIYIVSVETATENKTQKISIQ